MERSGAEVLAAEARKEGQAPPGTETPSGIAEHEIGSRMGHRQLWSAEHRVEIVLQSLRAKEPNTSICRRYHISEPTLYKWRNLFLEGGKVFLSSPGPPDIKVLSEENHALKQMVVELSMAYRRLRAAKSSPTAKPKAQRAVVLAEATRNR
jgi:transposase-like protein